MDTGDDVLERLGVVSAEIVVAELMLVVVGVELHQVKFKPKSVSRVTGLDTPRK